MARPAHWTITEMLDEIEWASDAAAGKSFGDFEKDRSTRYVVERALEIISEASRRLPDEVKSIRGEVDWRAVGPIGNVLRHEYHATSARIVWNVVHEDLPLLRLALEAIAQSLAPEA
jgi:uncharacterized protein with HEPN domain